jgi:hypothetical protein
LVKPGVYSHELSFHWSSLEYIPMSCPSIGQAWSIFPWAVFLLVKPGVYSHELSFHWLSLEYIPMSCPSIG